MPSKDVVMHCPGIVPSGISASIHRILRVLLVSLFLTYTLPANQGMGRMIIWQLVENTWANQ
jgi:hypothetical protein